MKLILSLVIIVALAYLSSRIFFSMKRIPLQLRFISLTGIEFIVLGYILGRNVLGLIDETVLVQMRPAVGLGMAWVGLVFGLQFNWKNMKRLPPAIYNQSLGQALLVWLFIFIIAYLVFTKGFSLYERYLIPSLIVLASSASISSPTLIPLLARYDRARGRTTRLLEQISSMDAVIGILFLSVVYSMWRRGGDTSITEGMTLLILSVACGVILALMFKTFVKEIRSDSELLMLTLAMVIFSGGISLYLKLSPLFINFIFGVTLANIHWPNYRIFKVLAIPEKPIYFMFLILSGAIWYLQHWAVLLSALFYVLLRIITKAVSNYTLAQAIYRRRNIPRRLGLGLIPQGGIPVAIAINFNQVYTDDFCSAVASTIILSIVLNELLGPTLARNVLRKAGDIR
ncbi:MAG: cation:proton antiporter [Candidatus Glassbacteria bacterium]